MLTAEQKQQILADPNFQTLVGGVKKPITEPTPISSSTIPVLSFKERATQLRTKPQIAQQPIQPIETVEEPKKPSLFSRIGDIFKTSIKEQQEIVDKENQGEINKIAESIGVAGVGAKAIAETGFEVVATGVKKWMDIFTSEQDREVFKTQASKVAEKFFKSESGKSVLEIVDTGVEEWDKFEKRFPSTAENVKGLARIAELIPAQKGVSVTKKGLKGVVGATGEVLEQQAKKTIIKKTSKIDDIVGRITQGTKKEIVAAKQALKKLDTTKVKTFEDLKNLSDDAIGAIAKKQDDLLDKTPALVKLSQFTKKVGDREQNFVKRAIEQLQEVYDKTEDLVKLNEINILEKKVLKEGITAREVNSLARRFNQDMPNAFSKIGEPLTSVNKVASENVRKELKKDARSLLPKKAGGKTASELLDDQMTNLFTLKRTSEKMEGTVQKLYNKVKKRGLLERAARKAGLAIDVATFGTVRGFLTSFLPSNIGNKVLNSIDIEEQLIKNLKQLDKLNLRIDKLSDDNAMSALSGILRDINKSKKPLIETTMTKKTIPSIIKPKPKVKPKVKSAGDDFIGFLKRQ